MSSGRHAPDFVLLFYVTLAKTRAHNLCKTQDVIDAEKDKEMSIGDIQLRRAHVVRANLKLTAKVRLEKKLMGL